MCKQTQSSYEKAVAELILFENADVIATSGINSIIAACETASNKNGVDCTWGLTATVGVDCWNNNAID